MASSPSKGWLAGIAAVLCGVSSGSVLADGGVCAPLSDPYARLACYERQVMLTGASSDCVRLPAESSRLACYDAKQALGQPAPRSLSPLPPPSSLSSWLPPIRLEGGIDYGQGRYDGTLKLLGGQTRLQSALGGAGAQYHGGLWWDGVGTSWLSLGFDHSAIRNVARITTLLPNRTFSSSATGSSPGRIDANLGTDITHLNVEARVPKGPFQPYMVFGFGGGRGWVTGGYSLTGLLQASGPVSAASWVGDVQSVFGFDWSPLSWFKIGPEARVSWFTARPFGIDQQYIDIAIGFDAAIHF